MLDIWLKFMVSVLVMVALCIGMVLTTLARNIPAGKERSVVTELVRVRYDMHGTGGIRAGSSVTSFWCRH